VHKDPGKSWNVEFKFSRPGKSRKINQMAATFLTRVHQNPCGGSNQLGEHKHSPQAS